MYVVKQTNNKGADKMLSPLQKQQIAAKYATAGNLVFSPYNSKTGHVVDVVIQNDVPVIVFAERIELGRAMHVSCYAVTSYRNRVFYQLVSDVPLAYKVATTCCVTSVIVQGTNDLSLA
jgi:hypothetical protein